jgi:hypothetical protein
LLNALCSCFLLSTAIAKRHGIKGSGNVLKDEEDEEFNKRPESIDNVLDNDETAYISIPIDSEVFISS